MMEILEKLSKLTAPSGWEDEAREYVREQAEALHLQTETDPMGNLYVYKPGAKGPKRPVVLAAYLDEPGMMVREVLEGGFLKFGLTGDTDPKTLPGKQVRVGESGAQGVVGLKPIHLTPKEERKKSPKASDLYLDIGATDAKTELGDQAVFAEDFTPLGGRCVLGKAMGRSVGCCALLELLKQELAIDIIFVFAVQHYSGSRGAYGAAARLNPEVVITLDLCEETGERKLGSGPVIPYMDESAVFARELMRKIKTGAERKNIPVQVCAQIPGKGDGGVWQTSGGGVRTAEICCPVRHRKAPAQLVDLRDVEALPEILLGFLEELEVC